MLNDKFDCQYINLGTSLRIDEIGKRGITKLFRLIIIWFNVLYVLIKFKPEICCFSITAKGSGFYKDSLIVGLIKIFGVKMVYHLHNKGVSVRQDKWADKFLYKLVFKNSFAILLSSLLYPDVKKFIPLERVYFCPNGIPDLKGNKSNPFESQVEIVQILFLSNLIETKGVSILLDACSLLRQKQVSFKCVFVGGIGDIGENEFAEQINKRHLNGQVFYLGSKYGTEKVKVFQNSDIFALPTYYNNECFPLVLLEAMQFALPVVSTNEGAIPEIVDDGITGFIVPKRDPQALADKLALLIENADLRKQMGQAGRKKYESAYTLEHFETRFCEILHEITNTE